MNLKPWELQVEPRSWQLAALNLWKRDHRGVVSVVTGGGKTIFAEMCMIDFHLNYPEGKILIVVPTIALLDQWYVSLREDIGLPKEEIACFSSREKPLKLGVVNIVVINTARQLAPEISQDYSTFLVVDECHRAGSKENSRAVIGKYKATLGISATPQREYDQGFKEIIVPALGEIIYTYDYYRAYNDHVIVNFDLINVKVDLLPHERKKYDDFSKRIAIIFSKIDHRTVSENKKLKILLQRRASISSTALMRIPVAAKLAEHNRGKRTIIFHERVSIANKLAEILNSRNLSSTIYHSNINPIIRRNNLRLYRIGIFDTLISCRSLDEGMNIPDTSVAIIASSTASTRQRIQRLGRVLRPAPGKETAEIYTLYATEIEEQKLLDEANNLKEIATVQWLKSYKD